MRHANISAHPILLAFCQRIATISRWVPGIVCLLVAVSCSDQRTKVTTPLSMQEVAGRYVLSLTDFGPAVNKKIELISPRPSIELKADGTAVLSNLPVVADDMQRNFSCSEFRTGTGTFKIEEDGYEKRAGVVTHFYGLKLSCGSLPKPVDTPCLCMQGSALALSWNDYFDGDFVERMVFVRVAPVKK